jgi:hypothetical protein
MRIRMASCSWPVVAVVSIFATAAPAAAQQVVKLADGETLTISGFISATIFNDNGLFNAFGQGQNAEIAAPPATLGTNTGQPGANRAITDGDVRNTRIRFEFASQPVLGKWAPKGVVEFDFFSAFNGAPPFGDEQPQVRGRLLYADLTTGRTTLRIGQNWAPLFGEVPVSLTHIAFPLGYGATGMIGWRFPGIFFYQDLATAGKPLSAQLQLAVMKGSGPLGAGAVDAFGSIGSGEASGLPQLEARLNVGSKGKSLSWSAYAVGHIDWKDTTGNGAPGSNMTGSGFEFGGNLAPGHLTVHGNIYMGKALGQQFAHISQNAPGQGRISGWGAWAQAGYDFTPHWSFWVFYGMDQPDYAKFATDYPAVVGGLPRQGSHDGDALLRFRAGRYAIGLEYFRASTRWTNGPASAGQLALSVLHTI